MREIFTRYEDDGSLDHIEIELDAGEYKKGYPWLFSVFIKFDSKDDGSEAYENFLETKESLILAIEYDGKAKYLGSMVVDGWNEVYFCASSSKDLNTTVTAMLKNTKYAYESNIVKDKKWGFYETQLFPTELELAHLQSEKIIFLLEEEGDNLESSRVVEHYLSFETPTQKDRFIDSLDDEFSFKDEVDSEDMINGIVVVKEHNVSKQEVMKNVNHLFEIVKKAGGYYEGWSTTLVLN